MYLPLGTDGLMGPANFMWRHGINIDKGYTFYHHQKQYILLVQNRYVDNLRNFLARKSLKNSRLKDKDGGGLENIVQIL